MLLASLVELHGFEVMLLRAAMAQPSVPTATTAALRSIAWTGCQTRRNTECQLTTKGTRGTSCVGAT
eukprot:1933636-Prymnesium_polylepis.1